MHTICVVKGRPKGRNTVPNTTKSVLWIPSPTRQHYNEGNLHILKSCFSSCSAGSCIKVNYEKLSKLMIKGVKNLFASVMWVYDPYSIKWNEPRREKTGLRVSDQVQHKPGCTVSEAGQKLEISDIRRRGNILSVLRKQRRWSASRLPRSWSAPLFSHRQKSGFLTMRLKCYHRYKVLKQPWSCAHL